MNTSLDIVILGLSFSSSWGNGHATTYRSLIKGLSQEGHNVTFLERDVEWYAINRDVSSSPHCKLYFYKDLEELKNRFPETILNADLVIVGSYLKNGIAIGDWVLNQAQGLTAFYDIDTHGTLSKLEAHDYEYLTPELIPRYDLYLSFSGGDVLTKLEEQYNASKARPLYCSVDSDLYYPESKPKRWQLGYLGTYSADRQLMLDSFLINTAEHQPKDSFVIAGSQYPPDIYWPKNITRFNHLPPSEHRDFYNHQVFTLNVTRMPMVNAGFGPSVRLFEAAACGIPIISDYWKGLDNFFEPGKEILIAESTFDVQRYLNFSHEQIALISRKARNKVLENHTSRSRAKQLTTYINEFRKVTA